ncbi:MAG: HisA/HisF-related TIM barrel protein [Boseongicola sp.]|nr:HisA/HisF-related TIM barrel protein [Boseongicola sp.]
MLTKRIIACLDVVDGLVTKARKFQDNIEIRPAVDVISDLYGDGIDEVIFYDIKASSDNWHVARFLSSLSACNMLS